MKLIDQIYGKYILNKYKKEFQDFEDTALPIINEEIVKHQNKIVKEVMNSNNQKTIKEFKETILILREMSTLISDYPLHLEADLFEYVGDGEICKLLNDLILKISEQELGD